MHDGKALQAATSHYFGDGFARAFNMTYQDKENKLQYVHQTSWGSTTRLIGALIMSHGDNNGLVLPPKVAPIQVIILPIAQHKEGVLDKAFELRDRLSKSFRVRVDSSEQSAGWKFAEYEMKGVPLRLEIGPKDIEKNQCVLVRRDNREKIFVSLDELECTIEKALNDYGKAIYDKALTRLLTKSKKSLRPAATVLLRLCGAAKRNARIRSKSLRASARAAFPLSRNSFRTNVSAAASLQSIWYTGEKHINIREL